MTDLRQAVDDYLRLRRSLGHQMAEAAHLLPDFVSFMDQRGERTVTVAAALLSDVEGVHGGDVLVVDVEREKRPRWP